MFRPLMRLLVAIHAGELANVRENVLQAVGELKIASLTHS